MNRLNVRLLLVHIWNVRRVLPLQGKGRPRHAQGASTSSLSLLGQSYALVLPSVGAIGVRSQQVGQPRRVSPRCLRWQQVVTLRRWREPRATAAASGLAGAAHGAKADAILGYHSAGEVRAKKADRSPAGAAPWWHAQRFCHLSLASRKLRTLRRQERAGCQQLPRTNGFRSWQQCCP